MIRNDMAAQTPPSSSNAPREEPASEESTECFAEARRLLRENRDKLDSIVAQLLARESLEEPEIYAAAGIERSSVTTVPTPTPMASR
jgi:hypothetical protein